MSLSGDVREVRAFNRFYTHWVGALGEAHLDTDYSLTETRVLYEIAHQELPTAKVLGEALRLDPGYISRLLKRFRDRGLVATRPCPDDARVRQLTLTDAGWAVFGPLQERTRQAVAARIEPLGEEGRAKLIGAMQTVRALLSPDADADAPRAYLLRPHRPGDVGWVVRKHAEIYCGELGWDAAFEATVARIGADFLDTFDPATHCAWIAERDGVPIGSVFVVPGDDSTAKLRMLLVDRRSRGLGVGRRLVDETIRFARGAGYVAMTLWTFDVLTAATAIYRGAGFGCERSESVEAFGQRMGEQVWRLEL